MTTEPEQLKAEDGSYLHELILSTYEHIIMKTSQT